MKFELYRDNRGEWRWRLVAGNGKIIATSGEGYQNKSDCLHTVGLVQDCALAQIVTPASVISEEQSQPKHD